MTVLDALVGIDPLSPVRRALVSRARAVSEGWLADADGEAAEVLAQAEREASAIREQARAQGETDAEAVLTSERTRARRQARGAVLRARRESTEELRRQVLAEVAALRQDPDYPLLRERLAARARRTLGPDAVVTDAPGGGVVAESAGRRVALTLESLADRAIERLGPDVDGLWAP